MAMRRYKLKSGAHSDFDFSKDPILDDQGNPVSYPTKTFKRNEVVHSPLDLVKKFGAERFEDVGESPYKDQRVKMTSKPRGFAGRTGRQVTEELYDQVSSSTENPPAELAGDEPVSHEEPDSDEDEDLNGGETTATLKSMTVEELKELASGEKIDLKGATTKAQIIKKIRAAHK